MAKHNDNVDLLKTEPQQHPLPPPEYQPSSQPPPHPEEPLEQENPSNPPGYKSATSALSPTITHQFTRRHLWTSKVQVETSGVARYTFTPGPKTAVWLYAGASTSTSALGYLTFPQMHNAFRLYFRGTEVPVVAGAKKGEPATAAAVGRGAGPAAGGGPRIEGIDDEGFVLSDVKARVGVPHVSTFTFKSSVAVSDRIREYEWSNKTPTGSSGPVRYVLSASSIMGWEELATLVVTSRKGKGKDGTSLRWRKAPESELEQAFLILSAIGVITRLSKKGVFREVDEGAGRERWFAFWWMAALSTAAMM